MAEPGPLVAAILDYGNACYEHGAAMARYEANERRLGSAADRSEVQEAGRECIVRYSVLMAVMDPWVLQHGARTSEPGT